MRRILLTASALAMISGVALAQTSTSGSTSNATNSSGSQSTAVSNPHATVTGNSVGNGASASTSGAKSVANTRSSSGASANPTLVSRNATNVYISQQGSNSNGGGSSGGASGGGSGAADPTTANLNTNYTGSYTVRNTPEVIAPNVLGGNPCAVGASGGLALPGFGFSAGTTWADKACERRQQAALLFNMGEQNIARELMCQDDQIRKAMQSAGKPCIADKVVAQVEQPAIAPRQTAQAIPATLVVPPTKVASNVPVPSAHAKAIPAWCSKAAPSTEASKAYVAQVCS